MRNKLAKLVFIVPFLVMAFIFACSATAGVQSSNMSMKVAKDVLSVVETNQNDIALTKSARSIQYPVRKVAHVTMYAALSAAFLFAFRFNKVKKLQALSYTLLICILFALSDEFHQIFVPNRTAELLDVIIDLAGVSITYMLYLIGDYIKNGQKSFMIAHK